MHSALEARLCRRSSSVVTLCICSSHAESHPQKEASWRYSKREFYINNSYKDPWHINTTLANENITKVPKIEIENIIKVSEAGNHERRSHHFTTTQHHCISSPQFTRTHSTATPITPSDDCRSPQFMTKHITFSTAINGVE